jgi:hypothetical protein
VPIKGSSWCHRRDRSGSRGLFSLFQPKRV